MEKTITGELNIDYVICPYCQQHFPTIGYKHLKKHGKTLSNMREEFPGTIEICQKTMDKRKAGAKRGSTANKMKTINCCHCGSEMQVRNNESNNQACQSCLDSGLKNPDGRTKQQANERRKLKLQKIHGEGVTNARHIKSVEEKIKSTSEKRYGGIGFASKELAEKTRKKVLEKYGVRNWKQTEEGRLQTSKLMDDVNIRTKSGLSRRGIPDPYKGKTIYEKLKNISPEEYLQKLHYSSQAKFLGTFEEKQKEFGVELIGEYFNALTPTIFKCLKCGNEYKTSWASIMEDKNKQTCPICYPKNKSKAQIELFEYICSILPKNIEIKFEDRTAIYPKEIDIYVPQLNVGFEYHGLYWHSEMRENITERTHLEKLNLCREKNIHLIQIFEDEWVYKKDIVKSRIRQILNIGQNKKLNARECKIEEILSNVKNQFLDETHIQGKDNSQIKLGAFFKDELVSVMTFSKPSRAKGGNQTKTNLAIWELNRFSIKNGYHIPGIAGKLLEFFKRNFEWDEIFSFADLRWSNGNLYRVLGFKLLYQSKPNYWYIDGNNYKPLRYHRYNYRKRPEEPHNIPEWKLRNAEGLFRIWDCGNLKFSMTK